MLESAANVSESEEKEQRDGRAAAPVDQSILEGSSSRGGCQLQMYDGEACGRPIHTAPAHDAKPVCLMHSRDPEKSDAAFQEEFEAILKAAGNDVADFTKFIFTKADYWRREITAACVFRDTVFTQKAYFSNAKFTRNADFGWATFTQYAHFGGATFARKAYFNNAKFKQNANFYSATFTQNANFSDATFTQDADFIKATFTQGANFQEGTLAQNAGFGGAKFMQEARFAGTKFLGAAEFRETKFRGHDKDRKERAQEFLPGPVFSLAEFSQPEKIIFYRTYLGQALFHNCDVSKVTFSSVKWGEREGKRMVFEEEVDLAADFAEALRPAEGSSDERNYGLIAELYQQLKKNYDERKDYWTAGDFHYGEMEMKRLTSRRKNKVLRWLVQNLRLVAWYRWASEYGESYLRPALWLATILLGFALLYPVAGLHYDSSKDPHVVRGAPQTSELLTYWDPFVPGQASTSRHKAQWRLLGHSCVTALDVATFQRDRTYEPAYPWGRLLLLLEILLVPTLFGLFLLAVQRQFRR